MTFREFRYRYLDDAVERSQLALHLLRSRLSPSSMPVYVKRIGPMYEIQVEGKTILAPWIRRWRYYRCGFDNRLDAVCRRYGLHDLCPVSDDDWVIDVGAYMGEWSLQMLRQGFNVLAIEPDPDAAQCFKENLTRHGPHSKEWALDTRVSYSRCGQVTFHLEARNADSSVFPSIDRPSIPVTLRAGRLDEIVAEHIGDKPVRAIKMDAEGAEPEALTGAQGLLRRVPRISIDAGPERQGECTVNECRRILRDAGFKIVANGDLGLSKEIVAGWSNVTEFWDE